MEWGKGEISKDGIKMWSKMRADPAQEKDSKHEVLRKQDIFCAVSSKLWDLL